MIEKELKKIIIDNLKPNTNNIARWEYLNCLEDIAISTKKNSLYQEFLQRYYYMPLAVILKEDEIVKQFTPSIEFRKGNEGYTLYFSKNAFLRNIIENIDDLYEENGEDVYPSIKKAIRLKRDIYRDVRMNGTNSLYYDFALKEYKSSPRDVRFNEYINICQKKSTHLLSGYNSLIEFLDKPLNIGEFVSCFNIEQLSILTCKSIIEANIKDNVLIDEYIDKINEIRTKEKYDCRITINDQKYTIDDLINEYKNR